MEIVKKFFPKILSENDANYFAHLEGVISSIDELANVQITKNPHSYQFRIAPSVPKYSQSLLQEILKFHNLYNKKRGAIAAFPPVAIAPLFVVNESVRE